MDIFRLTYMSFKSTLTKVKIRFRNLTVTIHQFHCLVALKKTYIIYHVSSKIEPQVHDCKIKLTIHT